MKGKTDGRRLHWWNKQGHKHAKMASNLSLNEVKGSFQLLQSIGSTLIPQKSKAASVSAMTIVHFENAFFRKLQWRSKRLQTVCWGLKRQPAAKVCTKYRQSRKRRPEKTNNKNDVGQFSCCCHFYFHGQQKKQPKSGHFLAPFIPYYLYHVVVLHCAF